MPWLDKVDAVLEAWNQGAEDGHVVADLLFGVVNPSGKLPTTYPKSEDDTIYAGMPERYPGTDEGSGYPVIRYSEGLEVGYRWHQAQGIAPLFPFGFGLSYTTFELSDLTVSPAGTDGVVPLTVTVTVRNTGGVAGAEVVQVYVGNSSDNAPLTAVVTVQRRRRQRKGRRRPGFRATAAVSCVTAFSCRPSSPRGSRRRPGGRAGRCRTRRSRSPGTRRSRSPSAPRAARPRSRGWTPTRG